MRKVVLAAFVIVGTCLNAVAADVKSGSTAPPRGSTGVYFAFFQFCEALGNEVEHRQSSDPKRAASLREGALRLFKVNPSQLDLIIMVARSTNASLRELTAEARKALPIHPGRRQPPEPRSLSVFSERRAAIVRDAVAELQRELGPDWFPLRAYIDNDFRAGIARVTR